MQRRINSLYLHLLFPRKVATTHVRANLSFKLTKMKPKNIKPTVIRIEAKYIAIDVLDRKVWQLFYLLDIPKT